LDHVLAGLLIAAAVLLSLIAAGHSLLYKRDERSALVWTVLNLALPLIGPFLYWCMGINRISRRARSWRVSGRRLSGTRIYPIESHKWESAELPVEARHLRNLRTLSDRVVKTRLQGGNRITPLEDGEAAYPAMLEAITQAEVSINLSSYIFDADGIGAEFVRLLKDAAARGVAVRVIIDAMGEKYSRVSPYKLLNLTTVQIVRYLPVSDGAHINLRNHRKLLIIDGREAFTGGMNIRSRHMPSTSSPETAIHDLHFSVRGPVVNDLQRAFLKDWHFVTGEILDSPHFFPAIEPQGNVVVHCISDGPDSEYRKLQQIIMGALSCAERSVLIMTPYFIPDRSMVSALITTALRGVDVRIVLPARNNLPFVHWANRAIQEELLVNGVRVFYQPPPFVHTKLLLVDDVWSLIGSANWDARSFRLNFELDLSVFDAAFSARVRQHFDQAFLRTREVTLDEIDDRTLPLKLRDGFFHLFSPYL